MRASINGTNHRLTGDKLELTALANLGVYNGGISSGQITTKDTFYPRNGKKYVFKLRAKVPTGKSGAWPAFWMYARQAPKGSDPQVLINLAIGGSINRNPTSASFPTVFSVDSFQVFVDCPGSAVTTGCHTPSG